MSVYNVCIMSTMFMSQNIYNVCAITENKLVTQHFKLHNGYICILNEQNTDEASRDQCVFRNKKVIQ